MANDIVWLDEAEDDLQSLFHFIERENPRAATRYVEEVVDACGRLADFPLSGRLFTGTYRAIVVRNHLVIYRYEAAPSEVLISAIVDGRRDAAALLDKLKAEHSDH